MPLPAAVSDDPEPTGARRLLHEEEHRQWLLRPLMARLEQMEAMMATNEERLTTGLDQLTTQMGNIQTGVDALQEKMGQVSTELEALRAQAAQRDPVVAAAVEKVQALLGDAQATVDDIASSLPSSPEPTPAPEPTPEPTPAPEPAPTP